MNGNLRNEILTILHNGSYDGRIIDVTDRIMLAIDKAYNNTETKTVSYDEYLDIKTEIAKHQFTIDELKQEVEYLSKLILDSMHHTKYTY